MLLIRTYVAPSSIHGNGVFTAEAIEAGAVVWRFDEKVDPVYPASAAETGSEPLRSLLKRHAYPHHALPDKIILDGDDCRYMNHSADPNVDFSRDPSQGFARRDIAAGTELTCDYISFAPGWYDI